MHVYLDVAYPLLDQGNRFELEGVVVGQTLYPNRMWNESHDCFDVCYLLNYDVC